MPNLKNIIYTCQRVLQAGTQSVKQSYYSTSSSTVNTTILPFTQNYYILFVYSQITSQKSIGKETKITSFPMKNNKRTCGQTENTLQHNKSQLFVIIWHIFQQVVAVWALYLPLPCTQSYPLSLAHKDRAGQVPLQMAASSARWSHERTSSFSWKAIYY